MHVNEINSKIRTVRVTVWLNANEAETIDRKRGHYNRASYIRSAGLDRKISCPPDPVAQEQWACLGHVQSDLNHLVKHLNEAGSVGGPNHEARVALSKIDDVNGTLDRLRAWLSGATVKIR